MKRTGTGSANGDKFIINQQLFSDHTEVDESEEKLCRLMSECGIVCE